MLRHTVLLLVLSITACSTVEPSVSYTRGTQALEAGDYQAAVTHLEEAVRLEPMLSRNHNNLASAYLATDRIHESWKEVRKAVMLDPRNEYAWKNQRLIFARLRETENLAVGDSDTQVIEKLGEPDDKRDARRSDCYCIWWQYGSIAVAIKDNILSGVSEMEYRRR
jgi:tetratricopeptide (TPR) repeat protein